MNMLETLKKEEKTLLCFKNQLIGKISSHINTYNEQKIKEKEIRIKIEKAKTKKLNILRLLFLVIFVYFGNEFVANPGAYGLIILFISMILLVGSLSEWIKKEETINDDKIDGKYIFENSEYYDELMFDPKILEDNNIFSEDDQNHKINIFLKDLKLERCEYNKIYTELSNNFPKSNIEMIDIIGDVSIQLKSSNVENMYFLKRILIETLSLLQVKIENAGFKKDIEEDFKQELREVTISNFEKILK